MQLIQLRWVRCQLVAAFSQIVAIDTACSLRFIHLSYFQFREAREMFNVTTIQGAHAELL